MEEDATLDKYQYLFDCEYVDHKDLRLTVEATTSITPYKLAKHQSKDIVEEFYSIYGRYPSSIIDATANVGGNTLAFASYYKRVYAFEIKAKTAEYLRQNLKLYNKNNVRVLCGNFVHYINYANLVQSDIIFIDPPWYVDGVFNDDMALTCTKKYYAPSLSEVIWRIFQSRKMMICVKLPLDYVPRLKPCITFNYRKIKVVVYHQITQW